MSSNVRPNSKLRRKNTGKRCVVKIYGISGDYTKIDIDIKNWGDKPYLMVWIEDGKGIAVRLLRAFGKKRKYHRGSGSGVDLWIFGMIEPQNSFQEKHRTRPGQCITTI